MERIEGTNRQARFTGRSESAPPAKLDMGISVLTAMAVRP